VYAGTFDDFDRFEVRLDNSKHISIEAARHGTILPPGVPAFTGHAIRNDGSPREPAVFDRPRAVGRRRGT
jgi:hypothetical protein